MFGLKLMYLSYKVADLENDDDEMDATQHPCLQCHVAFMEEGVLYELRQPITERRFRGSRVGFRADFTTCESVDGIGATLHIELDAKHRAKIGELPDADEMIAAAERHLRANG